MAGNRKFTANASLIEDQSWCYPIESSKLLLYCESTFEVSSAGNLHTTFCESLRRVTASGDSVRDNNQRGSVYEWRSHSSCVQRGVPMKESTDHNDNLVGKSLSTRQSIELKPKARALATRMAASRSHSYSDIDVYAKENSIVESVAIGAAVKYGLLAAGGQVLDWHTGQSLHYGKTNRRNPRLLSLRSPYSINDFTLKHYGYELL